MMLRPGVICPAVCFYDAGGYTLTVYLLIKNPPTYRSDVSASGHKNMLILSADMICTSVKNE
ncbi:hypothetical protein Rumal_0695 [Ruminococcus albus 7 = DSM 20455]|uniref:Uncharacterized protein n=1 Tax=Ruminococcus albus (strain ATCC 27210 / DSM 20455 / JCM 14654 / NCDO 2250 / 7) TaxID=697329 RepID=E6UHJ2_RUMA7|nr:hypothetical protein Rumal_0695 [Ruminococcus albus 7 = DSM 20455]